MQLMLDLPLPAGCRRVQLLPLLQLLTDQNNLFGQKIARAIMQTDPKHLA
jgi:hypothetical protein